MQLTDNKKKYTDEELIFYISLHRISFLQYKEKEILQKNLDSSQSLALLSIEDIEKLIHRKLNSKVIWNGNENLRMAQIALMKCKSLNIKILLNFDSDYPEILRQISDSPYLLFCRGNTDLLRERNVSVVGSRKLSPVGKNAAHKFGFDAVKNGCNVISGLANGADGYAHQGAVDAWYDSLEKEENLALIGRTVAVLPGAIDDILPVCHKKLAGQILQSGGCLISEYEPGMQLAKWHYVERNRIIAGLSSATVVIEAPPGSGSLITADFALDYNRDVIFHQAALSSQAEQISCIVKRELEKDSLIGKVSKVKSERTVQKYIEQGAPVIKDYDDFCQCLIKAPGTHENPLIQGELF